MDTFTKSTRQNGHLLLQTTPLSAEGEGMTFSEIVIDDLSRKSECQYGKEKPLNAFTHHKRNNILPRSYFIVEGHFIITSGHKVLWLQRTKGGFAVHNRLRHAPRWMRQDGNP
ncbi:hypothetical protein NPIL_651861 [Nephila pilipes]|uniref:Uncharacterized protein n=1 Tax=Nephila pilipes TaxID=299642 RepID=A0A8X6PB11_NEPPI|nr:hypothetical protein NPIL_651861 [Nephila pilipes]